MRVDLSGLRVTVMGLGVHGGGLSAARYAVNRGATVTVTDLRDEHTLHASVERLPGECRTVFGTHEDADFSEADLVIKNPAVPRTARFLRLAPAVTTDIALFLAEWTGPDNSGEHGPLVAVTGTKGKSLTSSAVAHILSTRFPQTRLGGNITISPLDFVDEVSPEDPVVLELSSFQLGDLAFTREHNAAIHAVPAGVPRSVYTPTVPASATIITNIFTDHQDYYRSMSTYVADKQEIYRHLAPGGAFITDAGGAWTETFVTDLRNRDAAPYRLYLVPRPTGGTDEGGGAGRLLPATLPVPGVHNRHNLRMAATVAAHLGMAPGEIAAAVESFPGVPHRLETVRRLNGVRFVNDTAATIPEAAEAAVEAFLAEPGIGPVYLLAGGSDKGLDLSPLSAAMERAVATGGGVALLAGTATDRLITTGDSGGRSAGDDEPPRFDDIRAAVAHLFRTATASPRATEAGVLLSPGCASFGMFRNEFDRGDRFTAAVAAL